MRRLSLQVVRAKLAKFSRGCNPFMPLTISGWKRAAIKNMADGFGRDDGGTAKEAAAEIDKLHSKIGQLVVERDFLASASVQLLGTRGKKW